MKKVFFGCLITLLFLGAGCDQDIDTAMPPETPAGDVAVEAEINTPGQPLVGGEIVVTTPEPDDIRRVQAVNSPITQSELDLVKGNGTDTYPYARIDNARSISKQIGRSGGVVSASLPSGVKMHVIVPPDEVTYNTAAVGIAVYAEMPTSQRHPALSDEYGYGAFVTIQGVAAKTKAFVVFDTTGGRATDEAANKYSIYNRCDPTKKWFNPSVCAHLNKVPASRAVDKEVAVVTPVISNQRYNDVVVFQPTIPIGIPGLIVTEIDHEDIYIPQKLDRGHANTLVNSTMRVQSSHSWEAAAFMLAWNLPIDLEKMNKFEGLSVMESFPVMKKMVVTAVQLSTKIKQVVNGMSDEDLDAENNEEAREDMITRANEIANNGQQIANAIYDETGFEVGTTKGIEGAAAVSDLGEAGIDGSAQGAVDAADSFHSDSTNPQTDNGDAINSIDGEATVGDMSQAQAKGKVIDVLGKRADALANDPNASIESLLHAAALAQQLGLDDLADKALEKVEKKLRDKIEKDSSKSSLMDDAALAQQLGLDDLADMALDKASRAADQPCDALIKKNLSNFGINTCQ